MAVVQQPIEDGGRHHLITKHLVPLLNGAVGADQHAALLVTPGDQLEEQVPRLGFERQLAQLIDDQQFRLAVLRQPHLQVPLLLAFDQRPQQLHRRGELHCVAPAHRLTAQGHLQVGLAHTGRTQQHHVVAIGHPAAGGQIADLGWIDRGLGIELKALQRAHKGKVGDRHRHRQPPLLLAGHLGGAEPGQGLAQVQLPPRRFLQQPIELLADGTEPQAAVRRQSG